MERKHSMRETSLQGMNLIKQGKVRDIYDFGNTLLIVATDRISAFDVVMDDPIPGKGRILTRISQFWFKATENIIPNHMISNSAGAFPAECQPHREILEGRSMWVRKDTIDFIKFRQNIAGSRVWDMDMFAEAMGKPRE